jgi:hypothetical protein
MNTIDNHAALVALDWADQTHAFACHFSATNTTETGTIQASPEAMHAWLEELHVRCGGRVAIALERGRKGLLHLLVEHPWVDVFPIHPATCSRFSAAFRPSGAKDDIPDAQTLLAIVMHHRSKLRRWRLDGAQTRELAALVLARRQAVNRRTQLGSQLRTALMGYFPQALEVIGDNLHCPVALDFLQRWPDLTSAQKARPATLRGFYCQHTVRRPKLIERRLALIANARPLTTDPAVIAPAVMQVTMFVELLRVLQKHIERLEARIAEAFAAHPAAAFFRQLPGAGADICTEALGRIWRRSRALPGGESSADVRRRRTGAAEKWHAAVGALAVERLDVSAPNVCGVDGPDGALQHVGPRVLLPPEAPRQETAIHLARAHL